ncbi:restriction endonuclease subunit S [Photobacterium damselae subsp. damselae]|uniref:restriction endonuclease subunit S n=1 Tax=Photobacterium damselae TaxID=38293 RepID=UPI000D07DE7F|nr:restriction endonuclease subunit S [Photobacterium damselae]PSB77103.1 restriction endonuclease subunit S [Photobacterium damselae subsp. damselae]
MSNEQNVPKVRFSGFSGTWESKELSELAEIVRGASPRPIDDPRWFDKNSKVGWLRIRDVTEQNGRIHHLGQRISKEGEGKTRVLHDPHLLLSIAASVGKPVINYVSTGVHDGFLIFRKPSFDMEFMYQWLKSFELKWQQYGQPGSQVNLNSDIVKLQAVSLPCRDEQEFVGNYFKKLDTLINQHQQKHDKLINLKKAMLKKMFPKTGETVPEIRFDGFSGGWNVIKFSAIFNEKDGVRRGPFGGSIKKEMFVSKSDYVVYEQRNAIYDRYDTRYNISKEKYQELINFSLASGDFIMSGAGTIGRVSRVPDGVKHGVFNQAIIRMKINDVRVDSEFFLQWIRSEKMQERLTESNPASAMVNLVPMSELKAWDVVVPKKDEQIAIGNYFQKLDGLIKQHLHQITKLKNIKQACLDKMFV